MQKCYPDKYITLKMCDEADDFLPTLYFVADWFVTND